ncbi:MAG: N-acetyltransferase [Solirubrobacterales bacterium]|nr:N-acetyltransferase [Solirubrobacterales bacterium]
MPAERGTGLRHSDLAPGLLLGEGVEIPEGCDIGANVVIHAGTRIGPRATMQDGAVIGKPPKLGARSTASAEPPSPASIGEGAAVCAGAVVLAGADVGPGAVVGDQAQVRERARIGAESVIGRGSAVDNDVAVGERVKVQTNCYVTAGTVVEDDVFIGPGVTLTNDNTMGRHDPGPPHAPTLRRACRVGGAAVICPGVEIGPEAFVAAGAVVTEDVEPRAVVVGVPARKLREVGDEDLLERWR